MTPEQARILGLERKFPSMLMAIESLRRQLAAALQAIRDMGGGVGGGSGSGTTAAGSSKIVLTTSLITARLAVVPGSGTATLMQFDGTSLATSGLADVNIYNNTLNGVPTGYYVQAELIDGFYFVSEKIGIAKRGIVVTAAIGPTSTGTVTLYDYTGAYTSTGTMVAAVNILDKTLAVGSAVVVVNVDGYWFIVAIDSCTHIT